MVRGARRRSIWPAQGLEYLGAGWFVALVGFWITVAGNTLRAIRIGEAFGR